ncbi:MULTISPECIES: hypothetical protein [unclassified Streptomyces]|uniref:hypothetical protein n=1 Tax=unclassified Streptomyces TaxID=2593676 RepID=UPI0013A6C091|nr:MULTISPECIES: hypothetical protein [unclassified Streptomyces]
MPREECDAPRKKGELARLDRVQAGLGLAPGGHDPLTAMHTSRADAGTRHYQRDVGKAPGLEERVPGRRYDSLDRPPAPRRPGRAGARRPRPPVADGPGAVFGKERGAVRWPYGLELPGPPRSLTPQALARHEEAVRDRRAAQESITAWAAASGLKRSLSGCCPQWLQRRRSRRCSPWTCTQYGSDGLDHDWLDRLVSWTRDGSPVAITAAPYQVAPEDEVRLKWWTRTDRRLAVARGTGWHGPGTTQIVMWRRDIARELRPA